MAFGRSSLVALFTLTYPWLALCAPRTEVPVDIARSMADTSDTIDAFCVKNDANHKKWYTPVIPALNATDCATAFKHFENDQRTRAYPDRTVGFSDNHRSLSASEKLPRRFEGDAKQCVFAMLMRESLQPLARHHPDMREVIDAAPNGMELEDSAMYSGLVDQGRNLWESCPYGEYGEHEMAGFRVAGQKNSIAMFFWAYKSEWDHWEGFDERARIVLRPRPGSVS